MTAQRAALILTGGGARAGHQVGIAELWREQQRNPFPIR